jgi:hypothetical protein
MTRRFDLTYCLWELLWWVVWDRFEQQPEEKVMSFVTANPASIGAAAAQLLGLGMAIEAVNAAAADIHAAVVPPAAEEVSAMIAGAHHGHHTLYQVNQAQGAAVHYQTVANLVASEGAYALTEAVNTALAL